MFVQRTRAEGLSKSCIVPTAKHGGESVRIQGCFEDEIAIHYCRGMNFSQVVALLGSILFFSRILIQNSLKLRRDYLKAKVDNKILQIVTSPTHSSDLLSIKLVRDENDPKFEIKSLRKSYLKVCRFYGLHVVPKIKTRC